VYRLTGAGDDVHSDLRAAWLSLDPARTAEQRLAEPARDVCDLNTPALLLCTGWATSTPTSTS